MSLLSAATLAIVAALLAVALAYGRDARRGGARLPAALRAAAIALLVYAAADGPTGAPEAPRPLVALDGSASMAEADPTAWARWRDSLAATAAAARGLLVFGADTLVDRTEAADRPTATTSRIAPLVRHAVELGRPVTVFTDRVLDDPEALADVPPGSRIVDLGRRPDDIAITDLVAPAAAAPGDTLRLAVTMTARGTPGPRTLRLTLDDRPVADRPVPALAPDGETRIELTLVLPPGPPVALLRAALTGGRDARPADDSVGIVIARDETPRVVLASTAPDADARDLAAALRESAGGPVRAFYRLAPGRWVRDGALAAVGEDEVRRALRGASLAVLHGDTAWAGQPATLAARALLLVVPPGDAGREGYVRPAPQSPLQPALAALVTDSLPPLLVGGGPPRAGAVALTAAPTPVDRLGAPVLVVQEGRPRRAVLAAAGWARWRRRGGGTAAAAQALLGAPLDWLGAARGGVAAPTLPPGVLRAGVPIPVARGAADTATLDLVRDGDRRTVRAALRFADRTPVADAPPLDAGTWRGRLGGAPVTLVVNAARELLPRRPTVAAGAIGDPATPVRRGARAVGAFYLAAALALAAEWFLRRRAGLR